MENGEKVSEELKQKILTIKKDWNSSLEKHSDDSSDEEAVDTSLKKYNYGTLTENTELINTYCSGLQAIALNLYWSAEVNQVYYKAKEASLCNNKLKLTDDSILSWIQLSVECFIKELFKLNGWIPFFQRYSDVIAEKFLTDVKTLDSYNKIKDFFLSHPRLLFKMSSNGEFVTFPSELRPCMASFFNDIKDFAQKVKIDYKNTRFHLSSKNMADEVNCRESIKNEVRQCLREVGIIDEKGCFCDADNRKTIVNNFINFFRFSQEHFKVTILERVNADVRNSLKSIDTFLDDNIQYFLEVRFYFLFYGYHQLGLLYPVVPVELVNSNRETIYIVSSEHMAYQSSIFAQCEKDFFKTFRENLASLDLDSFYRKFAFSVRSAQLKLTKAASLERTTLPNNINYVNERSLSILAFARLSNRSQTRLIRQKKEEAFERSSQMFEETLFRSMTFPCIKSNALETQSISVNGVRTDKVVNHTNYENVYEELNRIMTLIGVQDKDIARWIKKVLKNEEVNEFNHLSTAKSKEAGKFLANFTYMLFVTEAVRNPSCWVVHHMILDLIIAEKMKWEEVLRVRQSGPLSILPSMPMVMESAVKGARYLTNSWAKGMPRQYKYDEQGSEDKDVGMQIRFREFAILQRWLNSCIANMPPSIEEVFKIIATKAEEWYGVKINLNFTVKPNIIPSVDNTLPQFSALSISSPTLPPIQEGQERTDNKVEITIISNKN